MSNILTNEIEVTVVIAVGSKVCKVSGLSSHELPWLEETGAPFEIQPRTIIEEELLPVLNSSSYQHNKLVPAIIRIAKNLSSHFESALEITSAIRLHFLLEELESGSLEKLQNRLGLKDPDALLKSLSLVGTIEWKHSAAVSIEKVACVDLGKVIHLVSPSHEALPGAPIALALKSTHKHPLLLNRIRLLHGETPILEHTTDKELPPDKETRIQLPAIPVRHYGPISKTDGMLNVELHFRGTQIPHLLASALPVTGIKLGRPAWSVFFDMGSVQFKQMQVALGGDPTNTDLNPPEFFKDTNALLSNSGQHAKSFAIPEPRPSKDVIDSIGLPDFSKEQIDHFDDRQLAAHFARAVQLVARDHQLRQRRLIGDFYWAFPNLKKRDFHKINEEVNLLAGSSILGRIVITEESDCLRQQFAEPLATLGEAARKAVQTNNSAQSEKKILEEQLTASTQIWESYEKKSFLSRGWLTITGNRPNKPDRSQLDNHKVPTLAEWHEMFSVIQCDLSLSDYLVFDAGGYSLDVYGSVSDGESRRNTFSQSFAAGSKEITRAVREQLGKKRHCMPEEIGYEEAEKIKLENCNPRKSSAGGWSAICKDATTSIYQKPVDQVIEWLVVNGSGRGIPIILSGGGSRNRHLRELISTRLRERNLSTVPIDSDLIYRTISEAEHGSSPRNELFRNVVSAFHPEDEWPRYSALIDVIGGLSAKALGQKIDQSNS